MSKPKADTRRSTRQAATQAPAAGVPGGAMRETVESIAVAVILAFLFRAFVAEAFVIPTGSMAPTLMGQHKDVQCAECGCWYQAGASIEIQDEANVQQSLERGERHYQPLVVGTTCPLCRYPQLLDIKGDANKATFSGDRILVSKFIYDFTAPQRWDVIVFKYPFNAKQNFIKRLIGLPGESVLIQRGDVFIKGSGDEDYTIARKPDGKLEAMLQVVDDTQYVSRRLTAVNWPLRWQPWTLPEVSGAAGWSTDDAGHSYRIQASGVGEHWLRYHHVVPTEYDWVEIRRLADAGQRIENPAAVQGSLISDYYAYNAYTAIPEVTLGTYNPAGDFENVPHFAHPESVARRATTLGMHWVGDLAWEGELDIQSDEGVLLLQLTKGGEDFRCEIDIASGMATLAIAGTPGEFQAADGTTTVAPRGQTRIQGRGKYDVRYTNVDSELRLWVQGTRVQFDGPTTYAPRLDARPTTSANDPGDLAPVGIGVRGATVHARRLRVLRDIYYVATTSGNSEYRIPYNPQRIAEILNSPARWEETELFAQRGSFQYDLGPDQFLPLGDNSPQSSDARMWQEHFFERDLLIGRALLIYWPHPWYRPIPYLPNVKRMQLIH